ncbi:MAG TPA: hypothetical protein VGP15_23205 [Burkholderiales bacterium]|jgi:ElaB/YqjD/DUF883 family membrane-anchored ribosome-binding protein|nr:hypothetical protein [Burkholderiales bacterium]
MASVPESNSSSSSKSTSRVLDSAASAAHGLVDKAVNSTAPAARWLEDKQSYVQDELKATCDYVAANPLRSLAIAFVAGIVVGRITS